MPYRKWFIDRYIKELENLNKKPGERNSDVNNDNAAKLKSYEEMINKKLLNDI